MTRYRGLSKVLIISDRNKNDQIITLLSFGMYVRPTHRKHDSLTPYVGLMLANIKPTLFQCLWSAGTSLSNICFYFCILCEWFDLQVVKTIIYNEFNSRQMYSVIENKYAKCLFKQSIILRWMIFFCNTKQEQFVWYLLNILAYWPFFVLLEYNTKTIFKQVAWCSMSPP